MKIFLVGNSSTLQKAFAEKGYFVHTCQSFHDYAELPSLVSDVSADVVIIQFSKVSWGNEAISFLRRMQPRVGIIGVVHNSPNLQSKEAFASETIQFLQAGGDYLLSSSEPLAQEVLLACLEALQRRCKLEHHHELVIEYAGKTVRIDRLRGDVRVGESILDLTKRESQVMTLIAQAYPLCANKQTMYTYLYNMTTSQPEAKIIDVFVCKIRKKLDLVHPGLGNIIETVWGRGYQLYQPST